MHACHDGCMGGQGEGSLSNAFFELDTSRSEKVHKGSVYHGEPVAMDTISPKSIDSNQDVIQLFAIFQAGK